LGFVDLFVCWCGQFLRSHRVSRVVHREPSVPSTVSKDSTLYQERDGLFAVQAFEADTNAVPGSNIRAS